MARLKVYRFSCFDRAEIELSPMTILIGPQASGKSVISKLLFFFNQIFHRQYLYAEDITPQNDFIAALEEDFKAWFPPSAWGLKNFRIVYEAGPATIEVSRRRSNAGPSERVNIKFSEYLEQHYGMLLDDFHSSTSTEEEAGELDGGRSWERSFKIRTSSERQLDRDLGADYASTQMFVPAGRSFFTTVGKAVAAFEHGNVLDPVTRRFGRLFANLRDRYSAGVRHFAFPTTEQNEDMMLKLFGGIIRFERDSEFMETPDGRRIPFSILSSGQQELLPLWLVLGTLGPSRVTGRSKPDSTLIYIEEPEAHLFPSAQSLLFEHLAGLVADHRLRRSMLITTHSPYLLTKANNLILAGKILQSNRKLSAQIEKLVPLPSVLRPGMVGAYAIIDRKLVSIIDDDGLVDGEYLDSVSSTLSSDFSDLLDIGVDAV